MFKGRDIDFKTMVSGGGVGGAMLMSPGGAMSGAGGVVAGSDAATGGAIEPAEEDAIDDAQGVRQTSAHRFHRNHRLLVDIFNEYVVPDQRSVVTQARLEQLRKQVHSLEAHQEKLELELRAIDDKYEAKKRRLLDASSEFNTELGKLKEFSVSDEQKGQFYAKHYDQLQKQWKDYVENFSNSIANRVCVLFVAFYLIVFY